MQDGPSVQEIPLDGRFKGKLYRGPLPGSHKFDPLRKAYKEMLSVAVDVVVVLNEREEILVLLFLFTTSYVRQKYLQGKDVVEQYGSDGIAVVHAPIRDFGVPSSPESISVVVKAIKKFLEHGMNVLVHCHAGTSSQVLLFLIGVSGIGRTGLVLACFVKSIFGLDTMDAICRVRKTVVGAVQTEMQVKFVSSWTL